MLNLKKFAAVGFGMIAEVVVAGTWTPYEKNPVLGNAKLGTCFDVNVVTDGMLWYVFHAHNSAIRISPRRTGVIRLRETVGSDGYPRYGADMMTMRLL